MKGTIDVQLPWELEQLCGRMAQVEDKTSKEVMEVWDALRAVQKQVDDLNTRLASPIDPPGAGVNTPIAEVQLEDLERPDEVVTFTVMKASGSPPAAILMTTPIEGSKVFDEQYAGDADRVVSALVAFLPSGTMAMVAAKLTRQEV